MKRMIKRGDIYYAELNPVVGSEQGGTRPVLVISNNTATKILIASRSVVRLTFNSFDKSNSFGNLSPTENLFSIVIMDRILSATLCDNILFPFIISP